MRAVLTSLLASLLAIGPARSACPGSWTAGWDKCIEITIPASALCLSGSTATVDQLVALQHTDSDIGLNNAAAGEIRYEFPAGTKVPHEIVEYQDGTGEVISVIRKNSHACNADLNGVMLFDNSGETGQQDVANTYTGANFVHHMDEATPADSVGSFDATLSGTFSPANVSGVFGDAVQFDEADTDWGHIGADGDALEGDTTIGIFMLVQAAASSNDDLDFVLRWDGGGSAAAYYFTVKNSGSSNFGPKAFPYDGTLRELNDHNGFSPGAVWYSLYLESNGNDHTFYVGSGPYTVAGATNASPISITTSNNHALETGDTVVIQDVGGNTAANGSWTITRTGNTTFTLDTSIGNGAYTSGGIAARPLAQAETISVSSLTYPIFGDQRLEIGGNSGASLADMTLDELIHWGTIPSADSVATLSNSLQRNVATFGAMETSSGGSPAALNSVVVF